MISTASGSICCSSSARVDGTRVCTSPVTASTRSAYSVQVRNTPPGHVAARSAPGHEQRHDDRGQVAHVHVQRAAVLGDEEVLGGEGLGEDPLGHVDPEVERPGDPGGVQGDDRRARVLARTRVQLGVGLRREVRRAAGVHRVVGREAIAGRREDHRHRRHRHHGVAPVVERGVEHDLGAGRVHVERLGHLLGGERGERRRVHARVAALERGVHRRAVEDVAGHRRRCSPRRSRTARRDARASPGRGSATGVRGRRRAAPARRAHRRSRYRP